MGATERFLDWYFEPGEIHEVTVKDRFWKTAQFDNTSLAAEFASSKGQTFDTYLTLHPIRSSGSVNTGKTSRRRTTKKGYSRRAGILLDIDPDRPSGEAATDAQRSEAILVAKRIHSYLLNEKSFPSGAILSSGNGAYCLWRIDVEADARSQAIVQKFLSCIQDRFETDTIKIDQTPFDMSRLFRIPGTVNTKGDKPHPFASIVSLSDPELLPVGTLLDFIGGEPSFDPSKPPIADDLLEQKIAKIEEWIDKNEVPAEPCDYAQDRHVWKLPECPVCGLKTGNPAILLFEDGLRGYKCHHYRCTQIGWLEYRSAVEGVKFDRLESGQETFEKESAELPAWIKKPTRKLFAPLTFSELCDTYPEETSPVIEGLLRLEETMNLIADPKIGKSWGVINLAIAVATGGEFLGRKCRKSRVLMIDNELRGPTLRERISRVCKALEIDPTTLGDSLKIWNVRGKGVTIKWLCGRHKKLWNPGEFDFLTIDAMYRTYPEGMNENANADMTRLYNWMDAINQHVGSASVLVHHANKGGQGDKSVTDVGSGAGAIARAADCHAVIREHEEAGLFVLDARVRSFEPVEPQTLAFNFPLWRVDEETAAVVRTKDSDARGKQSRRDADGQLLIIEAIEDSVEPPTRYSIHKRSGMGPDRVNKLVKQLLDLDEIVEIKDLKGNNCYRLCNSTDQFSDDIY